MNVPFDRTETITPGARHGEVFIPASKSRAHRLLICAALSREESELDCHGISRDIEATINCLRAMGAEIQWSDSVIRVRPIRHVEKAAGRLSPRPDSRDSETVLPCGESGSTLRFLLPVAGALGIRGVFRMEGRLPVRPMEPLISVLRDHGMTIRQEADLLHFEGHLSPGSYAIPGNISSQYISGLLFALPLLKAASSLEVTGTMESADYIHMTLQALRQAGFILTREGTLFQIPGNQTGALSGTEKVESDWSSAAFFLCLGALSSQGITVHGMNPESLQGDRAVLDYLSRFGASVHIQPTSIIVSGGTLRGISIDASGIPDLVPVLSVVAAAATGETVIHHAGRLRLKESDRLKTTASLLLALGADVRETEDGLIIRADGRRLSGGRVSSFGDHRIAMSAAVAASVCQGPVTVESAQCTDKSFPGFWETLHQLQIMEE